MKATDKFSLKRIIIATALGAVVLFAYNAVILAQPLNGFDLQGATIPEEEVFKGGPPKDGIPSIDKPAFVTAEDSTQLDDSDLVLGISLNGLSKAYPLPIMNWHEIVNDFFGDLPVVVTFCPLCGSGMAFESQMDGRHLTFGVSGLLYNSDVLLYDRQTESLWSQLKSSAVSGFYKTKKLKTVPMQHTTWKHWREQYPNTLVLSFETGFSRNYSRNPYEGYEDSEQTYFPVKFRAKGLHPKERVIGLTLNGKAKAWPLVELRKAGGVVKDNVGNKPVIVKLDKNNESATVVDKQGKVLASVNLFWFAWAAFHPETELYRYNLSTTGN
jgi:hypothetical protein